MIPFFMKKSLHLRSHASNITFKLSAQFLSAIIHFILIAALMIQQPILLSLSLGSLKVNSILQGINR